MFAVLLVIAGADPTFAVVNRCPPAFTVENRIPVTKSTGYPVRGRLWTHPGRIHDHLLTGEHAGKWPADWIRGLTVIEAESLHSDDHEGRVQWSYVPRRAVKSAAPAPAYCPPGQL